MNIDRDTISEIVERVLRQEAQTARCNASSCSQNQFFKDVDSAVRSAVEGYRALSRTSIEQRKEYIQAIRDTMHTHAQELARMEVEETRMGRYEDEVSRIIMTADKTPGTEDIKPEAYVGDFGLTVEEGQPYGVTLCITPSTAPCTTPIGNAICMIAAGNSIVFSPHPNAINCTKRTVELINEAIVRVGGPANIINCMDASSFEQTDRLMAHPNVDLIVVTGGPGIVKKALTSGKKAICAGPGNPPAVVDETADLVNASRCILAGNYFMNGIQCICEKEIIVVSSVADRLITEMVNQGAYFIHDKSTVDRLTALVTGPDGEPVKEYNGKDPTIILAALGIQVPAGTKSIIFEVDRNHPIARGEYLMPLLPIIRVQDMNEAINLAVELEKGNHHTAVVHSQNISHLSDFVRAMGCTVMVKNGPSFAGNSNGGEGVTAATIAGATGEGITTPRTFTRMSRCVMVGEFNLRTSSV